MENDPHLRFVLKHYRKGAFNTRNAIQKFNKATARPDRGFMKWIAGVAAVAAVVLCIFIFNPRPQPTFVAAADVPHTVWLPDGSKVVLAPYSTLEFDMRSSRSVMMEGKAFFDVARNEKEPFEISTSNAYVKVLGTSFLVDETEEGTDVYVKTGKVLFAGNGGAEPVILTRGMGAELTGDDAVPKLLSDIAPNPAAWATGLFEYESTPLDEVLGELSEYYGVSLTASDTGRKLTAKFETSSTIDEIIGMVSDATETTITIRP